MIRLAAIFSIFLILIFVVDHVNYIEATKSNSETPKIETESKIHCPVDLLLTVRSSGDSPVCTKADTLDELIQRNLVSFIIINSNRFDASKLTTISHNQTAILSFKHGQFFIPYTIIDGNLTNIEFADSAYIKIHLDISSDAILIIEIPKKIYDTYQSDRKFSIGYVDGGNGYFISHVQILEETKRILIIPIPNGTNAISVYNGINGPRPEFIKEDYDNILSPNNQVKNGVDSRKIICENNLKLILRYPDNSPACVRQDTESKLFERKMINAIVSYPWQTNNHVETNQTSWTEFPKIRYEVFNSDLHKQLLADYYRHNGIYVLDVRYSKFESYFIGEACEGGYEIFDVQVLLSKSDIQKIKNMELKSYFKDAEGCRGFHNYHKNNIK